MANTEDDTSFFEKERDRLTAEICSGFEELLSSSNNLNRKLEEVLGMTREYETIASLWQSFHELMRGHHDEGDLSSEAEQQPHGLPGTGGHVLVASKSGALGVVREEQHHS
uniref:DASH complex subunit DAD1 n=1 Tax=Ganoderma boninense TaxID=34458 RepID=A0A5K1JTU1_9APHY|nr:N/A [Ganoderma boninense]